MLSSKSRFGEVAGNPKGIGPIDQVVGKQQVVPAAQPLDPVRRLLQPGAQVHPGPIHVADGHIAHRQVVVNIPVHSTGRADAVVEPVDDRKVVQRHVSRRAPIAEHHPALPRRFARLQHH